MSLLRVHPRCATGPLCGKAPVWGYRNDERLFGPLIPVGSRLMVSTAKVEAYIGRTITDDEIRRAHAAYNAKALHSLHKAKAAPVVPVKPAKAAKSNPTIIIIEHRGARAETRAERRQRIMTQYDPQSHLGVKNGL